MTDDSLQEHTALCKEIPRGLADVAISRSLEPFLKVAFEQALDAAEQFISQQFAEQRNIATQMDLRGIDPDFENVHQALAGRGKLLLVEGVVQPGNAPAFTKLLDLTMLLIPGGKERTEGEFRQLLADAGFKLMRVVPTTSDICVIEAAPA